MPELPEVETVTQSVKKQLLNKSFNSLTLNWRKTLHNFSIDDFNSQVKGKSIKDIYRRAKYIIMSGDRFVMAVHLRMTGKLYVSNSIDSKKKHISLYLKFGDKYLIFEDTRKFGRFYLYNSMEYLDNKLGVEPLSINFTDEWILENMINRNRQIKALLFDQSFICGLGNIYIDEALWYAKIHPLSISSSIPRKKILKLKEGIIKVLSESIKLGGTTIRDYTYDFSYVGNYALNLNVFGKQGLECPRCSTFLIKKKIVQRGTHYCPQCQKLSGINFK